jgi:hypothetical protein
MKNAGPTGLKTTPTSKAANSSATTTVPPIARGSGYGASDRLDEAQVESLREYQKFFKHFSNVVTYAARDRLYTYHRKLVLSVLERFP